MNVVNRATVLYMAGGVFHFSLVSLVWEVVKKVPSLCGTLVASEDTTKVGECNIWTWAILCPGSYMLIPTAQLRL